ncbi:MULTISPECIES: hypothetical protein [Nostoc]|uniref:Uncharacterized protein n=1 Tax=Nostoc paludosum FACHB-159 TaxID=2692908 RepID=A0ABR8KH08_9NOSO|nr:MULTISPECIES: hypothetical protein [Nostoc]MBD2682478.1 hypothetical protein [Nostoc sp. FACHB-857]MBD2738808.1 hypothetical protein [Nostoc paludosum FACHB-159]
MTRTKQKVEKITIAYTIWRYFDGIKNGDRLHKSLPNNRIFSLKYNL